MVDETPTSPRGADDAVPGIPSKAGGGVGCLLLFGLLFAGCYMLIDSGDNGGEPSRGGGSQRDATAENACGHFANVIGDVRAGILTDAEIREKLREIYDKGRFADDQRVAQASQDMLAAMTSRSPDELADATARMSEACADHL